MKQWMWKEFSTQGSYKWLDLLPKLLNNFTGELFTIHKIQHTNPVTYILKDKDGEIIKGGFYEQELLKTKFKDIFLIEKVLKRKGNQLYVKWLGFSPSKNSWVDSKDVFS